MECVEETFARHCLLSNSRREELREQTDGRTADVLVAVIVDGTHPGSSTQSQEPYTRALRRDLHVGNLEARLGLRPERIRPSLVNR